MVDFKKKLGSTTSIKTTDPIEIYDKLDRRSVTGPLRPAQTEILENWYKNRITDKDLVIKLHTGEGKTLVGLLILLSRMNMDSRPVMYVCPNIYLVYQVCMEAKKFGIPYCRIEDSNEFPTDFQTGKSVLITHVQKLFNGKTIFKLDNASFQVGAIVLDDSHACIDSIKNSFSIRLGHDHPAYQTLKLLFEEDLRNQGEGSYLDIEDGSYETIMPIPYWTWIDKKQEVTRIIYDHKDDIEIKFVWPILKDHFDKCQAFLSGTEIEISPYLVPIDRFGTFSKADQRILMSATTQDDSFFIRGLNFSVAAIKNPMTFSKSTWSGEKMILLPSMIDESLDRDTIIKKFAPTSKKNYGIVALVASKKKAEPWAKMGSVVASADDIFEKITLLKNANFQETVVIVNRYDGIDLPDEACRILIIDSMPFFNSLNERYEETCRSTSDIINIKSAQRIEQGLGRSVRGEKDYTVILLIGADLVKFVKSISTGKYFSEQTKQQIEIGMEISKFGKDAAVKSDSMTEFLTLIRQSLQRDDGWKEFYRAGMDELKPRQDKIDIYSLLEIEAKCELANWTGNYEKATRDMQSLIDNQVTDDNERGWYLQNLARYSYGLSKIESNRFQKSAFGKNSKLLAPKEGITYKKIEFINENRIKRIKEYIYKFISFEEFSLSVDSTLNDLTFGMEAEKFEEALAELGRFLGFISQRPDKEFRKGPDNLWGGVENRYFLFECKSEVDENREEISKHEANQMSAHSGWFESNYGNAEVKNILIISTIKLSYYADFTREVSIMRKGKLRELKNNVKVFVKELKQYNIHELSEEKTQALIDSSGLSLNSLLNNYTESYKKIQSK